MPRTFCRAGSICQTESVAGGGPYVDAQLRDGASVQYIRQRFDFRLRRDCIRRESHRSRNRRLTQHVNGDNR